MPATAILFLSLMCAKSLRRRMVALERKEGKSQRFSTFILVLLFHGRVATSGERSCIHCRKVLPAIQMQFKTLHILIEYTTFSKISDTENNECVRVIQWHTLHIHLVVSYYCSIVLIHYYK